MVSVTLSVPEDLKHEMDNFKDINWSAVAREAIKKKVIMLEKFRKFTKDSSMTKEDALNFGKKLNKSLAKHYRKRK